MDDEGDNVELTHELVEFLGKGNRATGQQYDLASVSGHPVFKTIVTLARNRMSGEEIADLLQKIPVLMGCYMRCSEITSSSTQGGSQTDQQVPRVGIYRYCRPMPVKSAGGREYYVIVD